VKLWLFKVNVTITIFVAMVILIGSTTITSDPLDTTMVSIHPLSQTNLSGGFFTIDVFCTPIQPIKAFELKLSFDASLIQANSVNEGNIFDGYTTFFNGGIIDNAAGTIFNVYGLILGPGTVYNPGNLVTISFTAKSTIGNSILDLYDVGVTNEIEYIPIVVNDGSVTIIGTNNPPNTPNNPNPQDDATNIDINTDLSWTCNDPDDDPLTYNIYLEANDPTPDIIVSQNQTATTYNPTTMNSNTHYYWTIIAKDNQGQTTTGPTWDFTTGSQTNNPPYNPFTLSGPSTRVVDQSGTYNTIAIDPDGDQVQYRFDWDADNSHDYSSWTTLSSSGYIRSLSHSWSKASTYVVKVQARDAYGAASEWSNGFTVIVTEPSAPPNQPTLSYPLPESPQPTKSSGEYNEKNNPPKQPGTPIGPKSVETGVEYNFTISTIDENQIRYLFDWGDGNYSNWSEYVDSNTSVLMSHIWNLTGTYELRGIAQDEKGFNSTWSSPLNIIVSNAYLEEMLAIDAGGPYNTSINQSITFDASDTYDPNNVIIFYKWYFGDGETGAGIHPVHVYKNPGDYNVTLVVIDSNGNIYNTSTLITVSSVVVSNQSEKKGGVPIDLDNIAIGLTMILFVCLAIFLRGDTKIIMSNHIDPMFLKWKIWYLQNETNKIDAKNKEFKKVNTQNIDLIEFSIELKNKYNDKIQTRYNSIKSLIDSGVTSKSEEKKFLDGFDKIYKEEKTEKSIVIEEEIDKIHAEKKDDETLEDINIHSKIDPQSLSNSKKDPK